MLDIQSMRKAEGKPFDVWSDKLKVARFAALAKATGGFFKETDSNTLLNGISWQLLSKMMEPYYVENVRYSDVQYALENSKGMAIGDGYIVTDVELSCNLKFFRNFLNCLRNRGASRKILEGELSYEDSIYSLDISATARSFLCYRDIDSIRYLQSILKGDSELDEVGQFWFNEYRNDIIEALDRPRLVLGKGAEIIGVESNCQRTFTTRSDIYQTIMEVCRTEIGCVHCKFSIDGACIFEKAPKSVENTGQKQS